MSSAKAILEKKKKEAEAKKKKQPKANEEIKKLEEKKAKKQQENEQDEEETAWKATFKIEGKDTEDLNKEAKVEVTKEVEVAKWDEIDFKGIKADQPAAVVVSEAKKEAPKDTKDAGGITFGRYKPVFNGTSAKSSKKGKKFNEEEFPDIGGAVVAKNDEKDSETQGRKNEPQNRFESLKKEEEPQTDEKKDKREYKNKGERPYKPKKDEFFGNFRENNKGIKTSESDSKTEVKDPFKSDADKPAVSSGGPPVFFTNNKKNAHTMAKAAEEGEKVKAEQQKEHKNEEDKEIKKKYEDRPNKKYDNKKEFKGKDDKFERKDGKKSDIASKIKDKEEYEEKPKEKKPKTVHEKADLTKNEWGEGALEDMLS